MSTSTLHIALPDDLRSLVDERVRSGSFATHHAERADCPLGLRIDIDPAERKRMETAKRVAERQAKLAQRKPCWCRGGG